MTRYCVIWISVFVEERFAEAVLFLLLSYDLGMFTALARRKSLEFRDLEVARYFVFLLTAIEK